MNHVSYLQKNKFVLSTQHKKRLNDLKKNGYCLIKSDKNFWQWINSSPKKVRSIINKLLKKEGLKAGSEGKEKFTIKKGKILEPGTNRLSNLLDKHEIFRKMSTFPDFIFFSKETIIKEFNISAAEFREPKKNHQKQALHMDWLPRRKKSNNFEMLLFFIYLEDSNYKNGATQLVPKSHLKTSYPEVYGNVLKKFKNEIIINAKKGDILILNANTWHRGGSNKNGKKRGLLNIEYRNRKIDQLLNLKKYLKKETKRKLTDYQKYLFAVRKEDRTQKNDSFGPGQHRRNWLKKNPQYNYSS